MSTKYKKEDLIKNNFLANAMRIRYKIELEDSEETMRQKILGTWVDPNAPVPEVGEIDEDGFIEF